jgi:small subunit ribosomal protein S16
MPETEVKLAVKIRLKKMGSKKRPFYRFVAADSRFPRDGRFLETLGHYNPMVEPAEINVDEDKVYKWLRNGAKPTVNAANLLRSAGILERWELLKSGVPIPELDSKIEEMRSKQPKAQVRERKKLSKKAAAAAKAAAEAEASKTADEAGAGEETPAEEEPRAPGESGEKEQAEDQAGSEDEAENEAPADESGEEEKS